MSGKKKIIFRADGNSEIGLGHITRSLALAAMLKDDFLCVFATRFLTDYLEKEIQKNCTEIIHLPQSKDHFQVFLSHLTGNEIVVLDNYFFDTEYQREIKAKGCKLVCIDDLHDKHFVADAVINHAPGIEKDDYSAEAYTKLCLGLDYTLLRPAFLQATSLRDTFAKNNNLLICFGGADPNNDTLQTLQFLERKEKDFHCHLVLGNVYKHINILNDFIKTTPLSIDVYHNLDEFSMVKLMQSCAQAILPPSTISMEYLTVRNGTLYLKLIAENQNQFHDYLINNKYVLPFELINEEKKLEQIMHFNGKSKNQILSLFYTL